MLRDMPSPLRIFLVGVSLIAIVTVIGSWMIARVIV
jgi:hypothetical protein